MDYKTVANRLSISTKTVYNWLNSGKLEGYKNKNGEWEISSKSVERILKQRDYEGSIIHTEHLFNNELNARKEKALNKINHYCTKFNETSSIDWAIKIKEEVEAIEQLQSTKEIISGIVFDNMQPMEKL